MSTTTPILGLVLYDSTTDQAVTFATFRAVWGGTPSTSNFYKIDTAIGTLQTNVSALQNTRGAITTSALFISANYYEASVAAITSYVTGMTILLNLDTDSNGTVTLNINSLGTKSVMKINSSGTAVNMAGGDLQAGRYYLFVYDGTRWVWTDAGTSGDQIYLYGGATGNVVTLDTDSSLLGTLTQSLLISQTTNSATAKTTPADADSLGIVDSAASNVLKKLTFANLKAWITLFVYPVGAIYTSVVSTSPATLFGGTWSAFAAGRVLVGIDAGQTEFDLVEETGGAKTVTLAISEIPSHTHTYDTKLGTSSMSHDSGNYPANGAIGGTTAPSNAVTNANGSGGAHNNLQPYIVVYMWKRTA